MTKGVLAWLGLTMMAVAAAAQTTVTTSGGTTNTVPVFTGTSTVGNSPISVSGSNVGIGTTTPSFQLSVNGIIQSTGNVATWPLADGIRFDDSYSSMSRNWIISSGAAQPGYLVFRVSASAGTDPGAYGTTQMVIGPTGNVGIGTTNPGAKLEIDGNVKLTANSGASITFQDGSVQSVAYTGVLPGGDYADSVDVTGDRAKYDAGDLLVIDPDHPGKFLKSAAPYSTSVAGIFSTKPGTVGRRQTGPKSPDEVPMAMVGIVPTKVTAENGPIHPGDLLVTSSTLGYAMKGTDRNRMLGAVVGKALGNLDSGTGVVEVVVTLQ